MDGDSLVYASQNVVITRTDVIATGDTASMNNQTQFARLMRSPKIVSRGKKPFTLYGEVIDLLGKDHALARVLSKGKAKSVSDSATMTGGHDRLPHGTRGCCSACTRGESRARTRSIRSTT